MKRRALAWTVAFAALALVVAVGPDRARADNSISTNFRTIPFNSCNGQGTFDPANPATYNADHGCPETCDHLDSFDFSPGGQRTAVMPSGYVLPSVPQEVYEWTPPPGAPQVAASTFNQPAAHHFGAAEGRLRQELRAAAKAREPLACALPLAALHFARQTPADDRLASAYADLAVSGTNAFHKFSSALPTREYCKKIAAPSGKGCPAGPGGRVSAENLVVGCEKALDRAYRVANYLRAGQTIRSSNWFLGATEPANDRGRLGYIAVSGEDDPPHRPVNVPASGFPQYDVTVNVETPLINWPNPGSATPPTISVHSRYVIAQSKAPAPTMQPSSGLALTPDPTPSIAPGSDVLIFVHGMDSRAEEADDITKQLFKRLDQTHATRNLVVISVDLPTSGYAETIEHTRVSPLAAIGQPKTADFSATGRTPVLDFIEQFIVDFVDKIDQTLHIKGSIKAVMGGSLGGNMSFRLGRRPNLPWLSTVVVWSPASIWSSFGEGADPFKHLAATTAWSGANTPASVSDRQVFFDTWDRPVVWGIIPAAQADTWQSDIYLCKKSGLAGARLDRHETYDANFMRWHWRLAGEQLLYSHSTTNLQSNATLLDPYTGKPRYMSNTKRMLLACGTEDKVPYNDICPATQVVASHMTATPGKAIFLQNTGHSVDNERRTYFAARVGEFLGLFPQPKNGEACNDGTACASGRCDSANGNPHNCIPVDGTGNPGEYCTHPNQCNSAHSVTCQNHVCLAPPPPGQVTLGHACTSNQSCASGRCDVANGNPHNCIPNDGWGKPGDYCTHENQCNSSTCVTCANHACVARH
jgi:hypothetical protein